MIFITGSSGFVGNSIYTYLSSLRIRVYRLSRSLQLPLDFTLPSEEHIIIHCAWSGVLGNVRNSDEIREKTLLLLLN